jgi:hypothetical protein
MKDSQTFADGGDIDSELKVLFEKMEKSLISKDFNSFNNLSNKVHEISDADGLTEKEYEVWDSLREKENELILTAFLGKSKFADGGTIKEIDQKIFMLLKDRNRANNKSMVSDINQKIDKLKYKRDSIILEQKSEGGDIEEDMSVQFIDYKDKTIMFEPHNKEYFTNDIEFKTLAEAKQYIDAGSPDPSWQKFAYSKGLM